MKSDLMYLLLMLSVGTGQAAPLEQPSPVTTLQTREAAPPRSSPPSPAQKAEVVRRMVLMALILR